MKVAPKTGKDQPTASAVASFVTPVAGAFYTLGGYYGRKNEPTLRGSH